MTGAELHSVVRKHFDGVLIWDSLSSTVKDAYNKAAEEISEMPTSATGAWSTAAMAEALVALPPADRQKLYMLLYNAGCRVNR